MLKPKHVSKNGILKLVIPYLMIMAVAALMLWPLVVHRAFLVSNDTVFHMNQFYESAMQLKTGHFSWFLTLFGFHQTGRIVNAVYGPVFSYLMGGLLLLLRDWFRFQLVVSFLVTIISGSLMYRLGRNCRFSRLVSWLIGVIYMSSYAVTAYTDHWHFSGLGSVLMPLVVMIGIRMWREHRIRVLPLAFVIVALCQIHLLSTVIATVVLLPFAIFSFCGSSHKLIWLRKMLTAIGLTVLLTGNIWGSLLEVNTANHVILPFPNQNMTYFNSALTWNPKRGSLPFVNDAFGWLIALVIIMLIIGLVRHVHFAPLEVMTLAMGSVFLWASSGYFPWQIIVKQFPEIKQTFQFPRRLIGLGILFMLLTLGFKIKQFKRMDSSRSRFKNWSTLLIILTAVLTGFYVRNETAYQNGMAQIWNSPVVVSSNNYYPGTISPARVRKTVRDPNLSAAVKDFTKPIPDYLPSNQKVNYASYSNVHPYGAEGRQLIKKRFVRSRVPLGYHHIRNHVKKFYPRPNNRHYVTPERFTRFHRLILKWDQSQSLGGKRTRLPVVKYANTMVTLNHHRLNHVEINKIGAIWLHPKAGPNELSLQYQPSMIFKVTILVTVLSWLGTLAYLIIRKRGGE